MKKPIKDTKLGQWFREKAPDHLGLIGDVVPGLGALNVVGALIDSVTTSEEEHLEASKLLLELINEERESARNREVEFTKATGRRDWMQTAVGIVGMVSFLMMIWWAISGVEEREVYFHLLGVIEGVAVTIYGYYYGSSGKFD
jgi:hypothetical protein